MRTFRDVVNGMCRSSRIYAKAKDIYPELADASVDDMKDSDWSKLFELLQHKLPEELFIERAKISNNKGHCIISDDEAIDPVTCIEAKVGPSCVVLRMAKNKSMWSLDGFVFRE